MFYIFYYYIYMAAYPPLSTYSDLNEYVALAGNYISTTLSGIQLNGNTITKYYGVYDDPQNPVPTYSNITTTTGVTQLQPSQATAAQIGQLSSYISNYTALPTIITSPLSDFTFGPNQLYINAIQDC